MSSILKACLNGTRARADHPNVPLRPTELAREAAAAVEAGADALHVHPRKVDGKEALDAATIGAAVTAIRAVVPRTPLGVSTGAWIEPEPRRRVAAILAWEVLPDFASVNLSEKGAEKVCEALLRHGVRIEAGLASIADVDRFLRSGFVSHCLRLLFEPVQADLRSALELADKLDAKLLKDGVRTARLLHGLEGTAWPLLTASLERGFSIRIGLEDVLVLPDGTSASSNGELVRTAASLRRASNSEREGD